LGHRGAAASISNPIRVYPIALDLRGRRVLIAGGGAVAERKVRGLLLAGADTIVVVSPDLTPQLAGLRDAGMIQHVARGVDRDDVAGAALIFVATNDRAANARTVAAARELGILVDDASGGGESDFASAATHRCGPITFAVDTGGLSPSFARRLVRELAERFDAPYGQAAQTLGFARDYVKMVVPPELRAQIMDGFAQREIAELAAMNPSTVENEIDDAVTMLVRPGSVPSQPPDRGFTQLICATRASALAMWQTRHVMAALAQRGHVSTVLQISTKGDRVVDRSLAALGTDGVFVKELERALRERRADYAVHSCKDLPSTLPEDMTIAAIGEREDPRDAFCSERYASLDALPAGAIVGTSSPRRRAQLQALRPDLAFETIRGNVDTRLRKLRDGEFDAIVLAMAGLTRLGLRATHTVPIDPALVIPAVGQGALAIEIRSDNLELGERIAAVMRHRDTDLAVRCERAFLRTLRGGCQAPVGAHATIADGELRLDAAIAAIDGSHIVRGAETTRSLDVASVEALGVELGERLLADGGAALLDALATPAAASPEAIAEAGPLAGELLLLPRTQERPSTIAPVLREMGADVVEASDAAAVDRALGDRIPSGLLFPSSGSVHAIETYLARLHASGARPLVATMGEASSAAASAAGFAPDIVAEEPSVGAFVQGIVRRLLVERELL
jgi:hydroxymethylbilane synthase